jgi:exopolysaccharide production protein ExoQ
MNGNRRFLELLVFGSCAFVLTQALLAMLLDPGDTPTEGNPVWKLILIACYASVAVILAPYYREALFVARRNWFLMALLLEVLVSFTWAQLPALVLQRSIAVLGTTLLGIALAIRLTLEEQLRLLRGLFRILAFLSLACVLLLPSYGISGVSEVAGSHGEWRGIFGYKNGLGAAMALAVLVEWQLPALARRSRIVKLLSLLVSSVLLFFSGSVTSMFALAGSLLFLEVYKFAAKRLRVPLYAIGFGILLLLASGAIVLKLDGGAVTGALGRDADLTGRTEIWAWVLHFIPQRPILGYGYSGFWNGASPDSAVVDRDMGVMIMYSHNGFLEIQLMLGAVGLALTLAFLCAGGKRAYGCSERYRSAVDLWPLTFLTFFLLHNITECTILFQELEWAICVATVISADAPLLAREPQPEDEFLFAPGEEMT